MAVTQLVLTGVPAFVGAVRGPTKVGFFIDENEFDPKKLIEVDLAKNTAAIAVANWSSEVECDSQTTGGLTTIGPRFSAGPHIGGVYLAERLVQQYKSALADWPPAPDELYQYQAVLRSDNGNVTRYHGFKVRVLSPAKGTHAHVAFIRAGEAAPGPLARRQWIDLADPDYIDPKANGFTTIDPASPVGSDGAVFVRSEVIAMDGPSWPKFPRNQGW